MCVWSRRKGVDAAAEATATAAAAAATIPNTNTFRTVRRQWITRYYGFSIGKPYKTWKKPHLRFSPTKGLKKLTFAAVGRFGQMNQKNGAEQICYQIRIVAKACHELDFSRQEGLSSPIRFRVSLFGVSPGFFKLFGVHRPNSTDSE